MAKGNVVVQKHIFDRMDTLLECSGAESELAEALSEVFTGNKQTCMKILPHHFAKIVSLAAINGNKAPEFLDLLSSIVKIEELNLPLKRNQAYVMKYFMQQRNELAQCLDEPKEKQKKILRTKIRSPDTDFIVALVDLLATCAEGENRFIESINQTIYTITDTLEILNDSEISNQNKRPYARFLLWVYLNTAGGMIESGAGDLPHDPQIWKYFESLKAHIKLCTELSLNHSQTVKQLLKKRNYKPSMKEHNAFADRKDITEESVHGTLKYLFESVFPLLQVFFKNYYLKDQEEHPVELDLLNQITHLQIELVEVIISLLSSETYVKTLLGCTSTLLANSSLPSKDIDDFQRKYGSGIEIKTDIRSDAVKNYENDYSGEEEVNRLLNMFAVNYSIAYGGENTVKEQIGFPSDNEYTEIGSDVEMPLGKEFQDHINCFINDHLAYTNPDKYKLAEKLVEQLLISNHLVLANEKVRQEQEILDVKCLQLLSGIIHNEIVKLSESNNKKDKEQLNVIHHVQIALNKHDAMLKVLPHLSKTADDIVRTVLTFLANMLYNGNPQVQKSLLEYFYGTREEKFFFAVKNRINMSAMAWKENRSLISQHQSKIDEAMNEIKSLHTAIKEGRISAEAVHSSMLGSMLLNARTSHSKVKLGGSTADLKRKQMTGMGSSAMLNRIPGVTESHGAHNKGFDDHEGAAYIRKENGIEMQPLVSKFGSSNKVSPSPNKSKKSSAANAVEVPDMNEADLEEMATKAVMTSENIVCEDDGFIELVLRVLAYICDNQNHMLQDYLREQPDNIKSVNLVSEVTRFLGLIYSSVGKSNISMITQLFDTLVEFTSGNLQNQAVIFDNKVCDYINYLMRSKQAYEKCSIEDELGLKEAMAKIIISLIEENTNKDVKPGDDKKMHLGVAVEVKDTIDIEDIKNTFIECYRRYQDCDDDYKETFLDVGFQYFHIFLRFQDLDTEKEVLLENYVKKEEDLEDEQTIYDYYKNSTNSVEVLKNDVLQKVYFRVKDSSVLREEVKDLFKYEVDRTSPTNKLRDFLDWMKEIISDIKWQRRVLGNPLGFFFVRGWRVFNILCILMSLAISILVLVTWEEPAEVSDPIPVRSNTAVIATYVLGGIHNMLSLFIFISFFLSNHPYIPTWQHIKKFWRRQLAISPNKKDEEEEEVGGHLQKSIFSFETFYYIAFLAFSILGTVYYGYFHAFHLLHVAKQNQLLSRVILAVTRNGLSLLMVLIYSMAFFYIYALISFAFYRDIYDATTGNYCKTMYQCTVTVIRRGLIAGIYDYLQVPENKTFEYHVLKGIFDISFFIIITTIGLNIIFGIIVDTFSELRDSKWQIDQDMSSVCFICSRNAYDFEHHGEGFEKHVKQEHNSWSYLFFFIHLDETRSNDYTAIELFVSQLYEKENLDFFPLNRSLSLQAAEEEDSDVKIQSLMDQVTFLVNKWKEEDLAKERETERKRQLEWEEKHRKSVTPRTGSLSSKP